MLGNDRMIYRRGASQSATFVVAASDSLHQGYADYVCDGVANQVEIQAAIDALPSGGGKVLLMDGHYYSDPIAISSNVTLAGMGSGTILKLNNAANDRFIVNSDRTGGNSNIVIENIYIDGNKDAQTDIGPVDVMGNAGCLDFRNVTNLIVRNCWIMNAWAAGIETEYCNNIICTGNRIDNSADDGIGINDHSFYVTVSNNVISNAGQGKNYGSPCGIEFQDGTHDFSATGNIIRNMLGDGIQVSVHSIGILCHSGAISGNTMYDCGEAGVTIVGIVGQIINNMAIIGNIVDGAGNGLYGITSKYAKYNTIIGNVVHDVTNVGIGIGSDTALVCENIIYNSAGVASYFYDYSQNNIFEHNNIINCNNPPTDTGTNNTIRNNVGYTTENSGTATIANTTTSITVNHGLDVTPSAGDIVATPISAWGSMTSFYIDTYTATQFTIHANVDPGVNVIFAWKAIVL